ncbi:MAG TPA: flavodoxin [Candidatus Mcinerneyibacteriales bacterium]|nr:flavodoxin [Candidatus Mcinerneyibacteriales bacterium]
MKVALVVHSKTGHTLMFAEKIRKTLERDGHQADLVRLDFDSPQGDQPFGDQAQVTLKNAPDCTPYDAVLAGCPVWAFSATPVIMTFLEEARGLADKIFIPFVTMGFPFKGWGGTRAIKMMTKEAFEKGALTSPGKVAMKMGHHMDKLMEKGAVSIAEELKKRK